MVLVYFVDLGIGGLSSVSSVTITIFRTSLRRRLLRTGTLPVSPELTVPYPDLKKDIRSVPFIMFQTPSSDYFTLVIVTDLNSLPLVDPLTILSGSWTHPRTNPVYTVFVTFG